MLNDIVEQEPMASETILKSTEAKQPTPSSVIRPFPHQGRCHVKTKGNHERETRGCEQGPSGRHRYPRPGRHPRRRFHPRPGLPRRGEPGSGKTTLALQYLLEGRRLGEPGLYVTLSETKAELAAVAKSHGWSLDGITLLELVAPEAELEPDNQYSMFQPSEVELGETTRLSSRRSSGRSPGGSSSTRCPRCGCSPRARSATAGRSSR